MIHPNKASSRKMKTQRPNGRVFKGYGDSFRHARRTTAHGMDGHGHDQAFSTRKIEE